MDYSKKGIEHKQHYIKSTTPRLISKTRITLFRVCIVAFVMAAIIGCFAAYGFVKGLIDSAPSIDQIDVVPQGFTTYVYDSDGNEIEQLIAAHSNRKYVKLNDLPDYIGKCFVAIEDERFYEHDGIDIRGIFRAGVVGLKSFDFSEGASTITQQLIKNQVFDGGREATFFERVKRKIQEQYLAIQLENKLDKEIILEYYLNTINLGSGTYGIQTAAQRYFNKDAKELTLSEAATIAAIAQLPVYNNPITHPDKNEIRKNEILKEMLEQGYCSQEEYDIAIVDDVNSKVQTVNDMKDSTSYYTYFIDELIEQVLSDLQSELGYTESQASDLLYSGGLQIFATQDQQIQQICDDVYADEANFPEMGTSYWELTYALSIQKADGTQIHYHQNDLLDYYKDFDDPDDLYINDGKNKFSLRFYDKEDMQAKIDAFRDAMTEDTDVLLGETITMTIQPQSSFVIMDQTTGHIAAIIGGRGVKEGNRTLNRATNTVRQPGSTFKVLSTYLPALDNKGMTLATVQDDAGPYYYPDTETEVNNWTTTKKYEGLCTLRQGIYNSMNIVTVKTFVEVTPKLGYDYLTRLGITSLVDSRVESDGRIVSDIHLPTALGGLTDGVSNLEITAAYASIANDGIYTKPVFYTKILDHNGRVLLENKQKKEQVMKESTAWLLTSAMQDVVKIGTGTAANLTGVDMPVAGKTGSTSDYYDLWFCGFTPYYTASIWSGCDTNRTQSDKSYHKKIWKKIMEQVVEAKEQPRKEFTKPDSVVTAKICTKSGKLAVEGLCDQYEGGNTSKVEYFAKGTEPTEKCDIHIKAKICTESGELATDNCPAKTVVEKVFLIKDEIGVTDDTPFVLPKKNCSIHKGAATTPIYEDEPTPIPGTTNPGTNNSTGTDTGAGTGTDEDTGFDTNIFDNLIP